MNIVATLSIHYVIPKKRSSNEKIKAAVYKECVKYSKSFYIEHVIISRMPHVCVIIMFRFQALHTHYTAARYRCKRT